MTFSRVHILVALGDVMSNPFSTSPHPCLSLSLSFPLSYLFCAPPHGCALVSHAQVDARGESALHLAATNGHREVLQAILLSGAFMDCFHLYISLERILSSVLAHARMPVNQLVLMLMRFLLHASNFSRQEGPTFE
jgi:hypothetical protein